MRLTIRSLFLPLVCVSALQFWERAQGAEPAPAEGAPPSTTLQPLLDAPLTQILGPLDGPGFSQPEVVASLKATYADGLAAAPAARKAVFQAAEGVCDLVSAAMSERRSAVAAFRGATATHTSEAEQPVGSAAKGQSAVRSSDNFFATSQQNTWAERAEKLRQGITASYLRERQMERAAGFVPAPALAVVPAAPEKAVTASTPATVATSATPAGASDNEIVGLWTYHPSGKAAHIKRPVELLADGTAKRRPGDGGEAKWSIKDGKLTISGYRDHPDWFQTFQLPPRNGELRGVDDGGLPWVLTYRGPSIPGQPSSLPGAGDDGDSTYFGKHTQ